MFLTPKPQRFSMKDFLLSPTFCEIFIALLDSDIVKTDQDPSGKVTEKFQILIYGT
jgi:hypothetical protein